MIIEHNDNQIIVLLPLPLSVSEAVTHNEDDTYTIFLNERLSDKKRLEAYQHALRHIDRNDFQASDVQIAEAYAHKMQK